MADRAHVPHPIEADEDEGRRSADSFVPTPERRDRTWKATDGLVFSKKRITTWHPSNGVVFAGESAPRARNIASHFPSDQRRTLGTTPAQLARSSRLPPPKAFDSTRQRRPGVPPVEVPLEDEATLTMALEEMKVPGTESLEKSAPLPFQILPHSPTPTSSKAASSPKSDDRRAKTTEKTVDDPAVLLVRNARTHLEKQVGLANRTLRALRQELEGIKRDIEQSQRTQPVENKTTAEQTPDLLPQRQPMEQPKDLGSPQKGIQSSIGPRTEASMIATRTKSSATVNYPKVESLITETAVQRSQRMQSGFQSPDDPRAETPTSKSDPAIVDLLTLENFMLSDSEIRRARKSPSKKDGSLIQALTNEQKQLLSRLRVNAKSLGFYDYVVAYEAFHDSYDNLFRSLKEHVSDMANSLAKTLDSLTALLQSRARRQKHLYTQVAFMYAQAEWNSRLFHAELSNLTHLIRQCHRLRADLLFKTMREVAREKSSLFHIRYPRLGSTIHLQCLGAKSELLCSEILSASKKLQTLIVNYDDSRHLKIAAPSMFNERTKPILMKLFHTKTLSRSIVQDFRALNWTLIQKRDISPEDMGIVLVINKTVNLSRRQHDLYDGLAPVFNDLRKKRLSPRLRTSLQAAQSALLYASKSKASSVQGSQILLSWFGIRTGLNDMEVMNVIPSLPPPKTDTSPVENKGTAFELACGKGKQWSHNIYRSTDGRMIMTHYVSRYAVSAAVAMLFKDCRILGFDLEWSPWAKNTDSPTRNVSMIQIASYDRIALFHVSAFDSQDSSRTFHEIVTRELRVILEDPEVLKVGANIKNDCTRIHKHLGISVQGAIELGHLHSQLEYHTGQRPKPDRKPTRLADLVRHYFGMELPKDNNVRLHDWSSCAVSPADISYAAADAYAGLRLFYELEKRRTALNPIPDRPSPVEAEKLIPVTTANRDLAYPWDLAESNKAAVAAVPGPPTVARLELFPSDDIGPIQCFRAIPFARQTSQMWQKQGIRKHSDAMVAYAAWHIYGLDPKNIAIAMQKGRVKLSTEDVQKTIIQGIRQQKLPFQAPRLRDLIVPASTDSLMSTTELLQLQETVIPQARSFQVQTFSITNRDGMMGYALWRCTTLTIAEICLVLIWRAEEVLVSIEKGILRTSRSQLTSLEVALQSHLHSPVGARDKRRRIDNLSNEITPLLLALHSKQSPDFLDQDLAATFEKLSVSPEPGSASHGAHKSEGIAASASGRAYEPLVDALPGRVNLVPEMDSDLDLDISDEFDFIETDPRDDSAADDADLSDQVPTDSPHQQRGVRDPTEALADGVAPTRRPSENIVDAWEDFLDEDASAIPWQEMDRLVTAQVTEESGPAGPTAREDPRGSFTPQSLQKSVKKK